jgi:hypothetical protein
MNRNQYKVCLREVIKNNFNRNEIEGLAGVIKVAVPEFDIEDIPGKTYTLFLLEMIEYFDRRGKLDKLVNVLRQYISDEKPHLWVQLDQTFEKNV